MNRTTEISDEDLIRSSRGSDRNALETLYFRHHDAGLRYARRLMGNKADAEDVAQEAFLKVVGAMERGNGPETAFRPYLLRAVRTAAADRWEDQAKETLTENAGDTAVEDDSLASLFQRDDPELVMKAFQSLPIRWMTVLWHAEIEREPPRRIAPILGIDPGAVSALLLRARKGLREAYLSAYVEAPRQKDCEPTFPFLAATVLGTSSARDRRKVKEHARECEDCSKVLAELTNVGATMRGLLAPLILAPAAGVLTPAQPATKNSIARHWAALSSTASVLIAMLGALVAFAATAGLIPIGPPDISTKAAGPTVEAPVSPGTQVSAPALPAPISTTPSTKTTDDDFRSDIPEDPVEDITPWPPDGSWQGRTLARQQPTITAVLPAGPVDGAGTSPTPTARPSVSPTPTAMATVIATATPTSTRPPTVLPTPTWTTTPSGPPTPTSTATPAHTDMDDHN